MFPGLMFAICSEQRAQQIVSAAKLLNVQGVAKARTTIGDRCMVRIPDTRLLDEIGVPYRIRHSSGWTEVTVED